MKKFLTLLISFLLVFGPYLGQVVAQVPNPNEIWVVKTMTDNKILPDTYPIPALPDQGLNITACPGEYEPASFVVHARQQINGLQLTPSELQGQSSSIPSTAVDIRVVKCWFQAGSAIDETNKRLLTPELLLKDDEMVMVDLAAQQNYLRTPGLSGTYVCISDTKTDLSGIQPQDAQTLQPVDIDNNTNKQFWVTVHVPDDALPGIYKGTISLIATNAPAAEIPIQVTVLPFTLEKPSLTYSIYYHGDTWVNYNTPTVTGSLTSQQYLAEMKDLKAHGVEYPCLQAYPGNDANLKLELDLRKQAGLPMSGPLFNLGIATGNPTSQSALNSLKAAVQHRIDIARQYGCTDIYFYGMDEAYGATLTSERPAWQAVRDAGGKMFVSSSDVYWADCGLKDYNSFGMVGDLLDLANEWGPLRPAIAQNFHSIGHKVFSYSNPQCGVEEPETYRRNYGLALWKAGYDGAMDASYQLAFNSPWNDFDDSQYRDHMMVYPTIDGVIDTIQWEGWREGVDDVRYLTTLLKYIQNAPASQANLAAQAQQFVNNIDPSADLYSLRTNMINLILSLQGTSPTPPPPPAPPVTAPVASFSASPSSGTAPLAANYTDSSTGTPTSWSWNFGDGTTSTLQNPSHTHAKAGTYTVSLTARNSGGASSATKTITATTPPVTAPVASFSASTSSGTAPLAVNFTDSSTGTPTNWSWNFGDGATSTLQNSSHTYTNPGTYTVSLTVSNSGGSSSTTKTITATAPSNYTFRISPTRQVFNWSGGSGTISVTASAGAPAWTATSSVNWITITAPLSQTTGSGKVSYKVQPNYTGSVRQGTISIAGQKCTVVQR